MPTFGSALSAAALAIALLLPGAAASDTADAQGVRVTPGVAAESASAPHGVRLGGPSRYDTTAQVVRWRAAGEVPAGPRVRLVSGTDPLLAVAHGRDGVPTLFVPPRGPVPETVREAYRSLGATAVEVVGSLPAAAVRGVIGDRSYRRVAATDATAVSWSAALKAASWGSDDELSVMPLTAFTPSAVLPQAAISVQLRSRYLVVTPAKGPLPPHDTSPGWHYPDPTFMAPVTVVGGRAAISVARRVELLRGQHHLERPGFVDIAGPNRYDTAARVAAQAFPDGARTAYLVSGVGGVDAAATVSLVDGPVFLVPPCGPLPKAVAQGLARVRPERIAAIGDESVLCDSMLQAALATSTVRENRTASDVAVGVTQACLVAPPGVVHCWGLSDSYRPAGYQEVPEGLAPRKIPGIDGPVRSVTRGMGETMCAVEYDGDLWCWGWPYKPAQTAQRVAGPPSGVLEYAAASEVGCAIAGDGQVWCHRPVASSTTLPALTRTTGRPSATAIVVSTTLSCLLDHEQRVWCWANGVYARDSPFARTRPVDLGGAVTDIALGEHGLLARMADERLRHVPSGEFRNDEPAVSTLRDTAWRLLRGTGECYVRVTDSRVVCPFDTASHRVGLDAGTKAASFHGARSCAVRLDGSVGCRDGVEGGRLAPLGDGLTAPRYREADVLGFASE